MTRRYDDRRSVFRDAPADSDPVICALHAPASDEELRGYAAALATYRSAMTARRTTWLLTRAFGASAAGVTAAALFTGGVAAAAYGAHLPDPVQRVAHRLLGPLGVPEPVHHPGLHHPAPLTPGTPTALPPPTPRATHHDVATRSARVVLDADATAVPAGGSVSVHGRLYAPGNHRPGGQVAVLLARHPQDPTWRRVASKRITGDSMTFHVAHLAVNTGFRLRVGAVSSAPVMVDVRPITRTTATCTTARNQCTITVTVVGGQSGDQVLLRRTSGPSTVTVATARLDRDGQASFVVATDPAHPQTYRVTLPATRLHTDAATGELPLPPPPQK